MNNLYATHQRALVQKIELETAKLQEESPDTSSALQESIKSVTGQIEQWQVLKTNLENTSRSFRQLGIEASDLDDSIKKVADFIATLNVFKNQYEGRFTQIEQQSVQTLVAPLNNLQVTESSQTPPKTNDSPVSHTPFGGANGKLMTV